MTMQLYCTDTDSGTISVIDPSGKALKVISKIPVGNGPRGAVMFTSTGRGYVGNSAGDTISEIDAVTMRETARIKVGIAPMGVGLIPGDRYALVSNSGSNYVSVVDLTKRVEVHQVHVGREPRHMSITPDGKAAYVAVSGADYVAKLDTSALAANDESKLSRVSEVARISTGADAMPYSTAIAANGKVGAVANNQATYMSILDLTRDVVAKTVDVGNKGGRGVQFSPDSKTVFLTVEDTSELVAIDVYTGKILNTFETGPGPRGFVIDPKSCRIYVAGFARAKKVTGALTTPNTVCVVDLSATAFSALEKASPNYTDVRVGAGPCSVNMFHI